MQLPEDALVISLNYADRCRNCGAELDVGHRAHWSPSTKDIVCTGCAAAGNTRIPAAEESATGTSRSGTRSASPDSAGLREPDRSELHDAWRQLCRYARRCVEAEAARSLVPHAASDSLWFRHSGEEKLVVGRTDTVPAPDTLAGKLGLPDETGNGQAIVYGWPTVVTVDHDHKPRVAPLFVVQIEPKKDPVNGWRLHAATEPEYNAAITAGGGFDPSIAEDIAVLLGNGLPFGDADAFADIAVETAGKLGLGIRSPLDSGTLDADVRRAQGVYNAGISVLAERSAFNVVPSRRTESAANPNGLGEHRSGAPPRPRICAGAGPAASFRTARRTSAVQPVPGRRARTTSPRATHDRHRPAGHGQDAACRERGDQRVARW